MSRSVSAPSSVTKTSPCWNGLIVPGSTLMYGSNFCTCTRRPRALSSRPSEAAVMPLPSDETTPPVTNTYFVGRSLTGASPARSSRAGRASARSARPIDVRSPRTLSPASAPIAAQRPIRGSGPRTSSLAWPRAHSIPRPPASPSRGDRREAAGRPGATGGAERRSAASEERLQRAARLRVELVDGVRGEADQQRAAQR